MAKITVYIPESLEAARKAHSATHESVNWSKVIQKAIEEKIAQDTAKTGVKDMSDAIKRLRASKLRITNEENKLGAQKGSQWAMAAATWDQLQRLAEFDYSQLGYGRPDHLGWPGAVFRIMNPEDFDRNEMEEFWETFPDGGEYSSVGFLQGFCEGASTVYEAVKDEI